MTVSDLSQESGNDQPPVNTRLGTQAAPDGDAEYKKCPACGKFTRDAAVCRHCGHDLPQPNAKAKLSPGELNVRHSLIILYFLGGFVVRMGWLPQIVIVVILFVVPVAASVLYAVAWRRTQREGTPGNAKFAVLAAICGLLPMAWVVFVAMQIMAGAG